MFSPRDPDRLEARISEQLGAPVLVAFAAEPWSGWSPRLDRLTHPDSLLAYRRGRTALAKVLARLGRPEDPGAISFPHPELSLSHTTEIAVAAAWSGGSGLGVDLELAGRRVPERGMRLFLTPEERAALGSTEDETRLRLWTVKEALFKAHLANEGLTLASFELESPGSWHGEASGAGRRFRYGSWALEGGWLALAIALGCIQDASTEA